MKMHFISWKYLIKRLLINHLSIISENYLDSAMRPCTTKSKLAEPWWSRESITGNQDGIYQRIQAYPVGIATELMPAKSDVCNFLWILFFYLIRYKDMPMLSLPDRNISKITHKNLYHFACYHINLFNDEWSETLLSQNEVGRYGKYYDEKSSSLQGKMSILKCSLSVLFSHAASYKQKVGKCQIH